MSNVIAFSQDGHIILIVDSHYLIMLIMIDGSQNNKDGCHIQKQYSKQKQEQV